MKMVCSCKKKTNGGSYYKSMGWSWNVAKEVRGRPRKTWYKTLMFDIDYMGSNRR